MAISMMLGIFDWIGDFFKSLFDLIPKVMYLLYASLACVLDVFQLLFRKLAGLDVYYIDGQQQTGDIVLGFITGILGIRSDRFEYSVLSTVFWAFIIFGIIICFVSTIIAIVKSHYSYDEKSAKGPMQYVYTAGKAVINMVAVPIIVVLGLFLSQGILTALDSITSITSASVVGLYGEGTEQDENGNTISAAEQYLQSSTTNTGETTYVYYDIFGYASDIFYGVGLEDIVGEVSGQDQLALIAAKNQTFSGSLFRVAAYNANRVRTSKSTNMSGFLDGEIFNNGAFEGDPTSNQVETAAEMVDTAFANNLHLKERMALNNNLNGGWVSTSYFTNYLCPFVDTFSKFNVGAVWYYYDLWSFNFIVGFGGCIVCVTLFINIILGLISRIFMMLGLFLVAPPLFGLAPLDGGKAGKGWREKFMAQALMAYGAVVGMNLFFIIMPYVNQIDFFNIPIADYFVNILVIIVGFVMIKQFIETLSGFIGAADANKQGDTINKEVGSTIGKAVGMTAGAAKLGGKLAMRFTPQGMVAGAIGGKAMGMLGKAKNKVKDSKLATYWNEGFTGLKKRSENNQEIQDAQTDLGKAQSNLEIESQDLNALDKFSKQEELLKGVGKQTGKNFRADALRVRAKKSGLDEADIENLVNAATAAAAASGGKRIKIGELRQQLASRDATYDKQVNVDKLTQKTVFNNAMDVARDKAETAQARVDDARARLNDANAVRDERLRRNAGTSISGDLFRPMMDNYGTLFKSAGGKNIIDESGLKPKSPDKVQDKALAEATAKQTTAIGEKLDKLDKTMTDLANTLTNLNNKK